MSRNGGVLLFLLSFLLSAYSFGSDISLLMPSKNETNASIMGITAPKEAEMIAKKMADAMKTKGEWAARYLEENKNIRPVPYHPNFGISEQEYNEFIIKSAEKIKLVKLDDLKISYTMDKDGIGKINTSKKIKFINDLRIHSDRNLVVSKFGNLDDCKSVNYGDDKSPSGAWHGYQCTLEKIEGANMLVTKFAVGERKAGNGIIYYQSILVANGQKQQVIIIIFFDKSA